MQAILLGDAEVVIAGGQENMSQSSHVLLGSRDGFRMGNASLVDTMLKDELTDTWRLSHGDDCGECCKKYGISREEQDEFAATSRSKASARAEGRFDDEIVPVWFLSVRKIR